MFKFSSYQANNAVAANVVFPVVVAAVVTVVTVVFMLEKRTYKSIFNFLKTNVVVKGPVVTTVVALFLQKV
jgi:hypothetical protein